MHLAWIEKLFDAPLDVELSWPALDKVLRDRSRKRPLRDSNMRRKGMRTVELFWRPSRLRVLLLLAYEKYWLQRWF